MAHERRVIDSDGVERITTELKREDVLLEEDSRAEVKFRFSAKWFRWAFYSMLAVGGIFFFVLLVWGGMMLVGGDPDRTVNAAPVGEDGLGERMLNAEEVAYAFVAETDERKRLAYVRDPERMKKHLSNYPEQARNHPAKIVKHVGHSELNGTAMSAYVAAFEDGGFRMLVVVQTNDGAKVDWDCYARYCSTSWDDLVSGKAKYAHVRVFVRPGDYHVGQFRDRSKWTCFKLETPDSDRIIYAYAETGSDVSKRMQAYVMRSRGFRQHMTLKIKSMNGSGKDALFVVEKLLAMGWVLLN
ncbi:MAG: hypothetical protein AB8F34_05955 [Akkermansiaceae bacterium]